MKNWKQSTFFGLVAIIALSFRFVGCDDGKDEKQTPVVDDFNISGIGEFDYDGTAKTVTITPKPNKSTGSITVYYNGSVTAPIEINSYSVTFDVAEAEGFNAKNGLSAGTLKINFSVYGIPVTGSENVAHLATIKASIDYVETWDTDCIARMEYIKDNVDEFRVVTGDSSTWVGIENGKLIVKITANMLGAGNKDEIGGAMYDYAGLHMTSP
jgi:hypothetical protein